MYPPRHRLVSWNLGLLIFCGLIALWLSACAKAPAIPSTPAAERRYPDATWRQYAVPEEAGWSSVRLARARKFADKIGSSAVMVIDNGAVVAAWGEVARRYRCHSIRKSVLSALYGIQVERGHIDLNKTLADLKIDDSPPSLTEAEKQARIVDLIRARSGIFHPAAYETARMPAGRPTRGLYAPGQYFHYNNWDFNTLLTIFEQETGDKMFESFRDRIAGPVQMEDFRLRDGYYRLELEKSAHPAYPMRLSARDMARFGLLFARQGNWRGQQIVPAAWVEESTRSHSKVSLGRGYGYMWWVLGGSLKRYGTYAGLGSGGHVLAVFPKLDVVVVHRVNTFRGHRVGGRAWSRLLELIIRARTDAPVASPQLQPLVPQTEPRPGITLSPETLRMYAGDYPLETGTVIRIAVEEGELIARTRWGNYALIPLSRTAFRIEDSGSPVLFELNAAGRPERVLFPTVFIHVGFYHLRRRNFDKAIEILQRNVAYFPNSPRAHAFLGLGYQRRGDEAMAIKHYRKALQLDPRNARAQRSLQRLTSS